MDEFEKNEILKQVGTILQFCQDIVSRLSSLPPPPAITEANESIAKFSDEEGKVTTVVIAEFESIEPIEKESNAMSENL